MPETTQKIPYFRLSGFYLFYFGTLGILLPFWGPYLDHLGFSASEVGELTAILGATKILSPVFLGWWADHHGKHLWMVRFASLVSMVCFAAFFFISGYWWVALVIAAFSFFWNASLPQLEAVAIKHLERVGALHRYASIRMWGSIGFILMVIGVGWLVEQFGMQWVPISLFALLVVIWLSSLWVPPVKDAPTQEVPVYLGKVLRQPVVIAFFLVVFLNQVAHGSYYPFYSLYMAEFGHGQGLIGLLWAVSVIAEVLIFLVMGNWVARFGARKLLLIGLVFAALRWIGIGTFPESVALMFVVQTFHAASFGIIHAVAIHMIHQFFPGKLQGRGQALYGALSYGFGGMIGSLAGGYIWGWFSPPAIFMFATVVTLLAWGIVWGWIGRGGRVAPENS